MEEVDKETRKRLYNIWHTAVRRCHDTVHMRKDYPHYGGRGIRVCPEWRGTEEKDKWNGHGYLVFEEWALTHGYEPDLTLDRVNNNSGYSPGNCRWISKKAQAYNRSSNQVLTYNGMTKTRVEWSRQCNIPKYTITKRLASGWSVERCLTTPTRSKVSFKSKD